MFQINLFTTYYNEENNFRKQELLSCMQKNILNKTISKITIFNEGESLAYLAPTKIKEVFIEKRPTYRDFINYINANSNPDDINIIANTDIFFDKNLEVLKYINLNNTCLALSRWDTTDTIRPKLYNRNDSQDAWVFKGFIKQCLKADFPLGVPRCDNRLTVSTCKKRVTRCSILPLVLKFFICIKGSAHWCIQKMIIIIILNRRFVICFLTIYLGFLKHFFLI